MLNQLFHNRFLELKFERYNHTSVNATLLSCVFSHNRDLKMENTYELFKTKLKTFLMNQTFC